MKLMIFVAIIFAICVSFAAADEEDGVNDQLVDECKEKCYSQNLVAAEQFVICLRECLGLPAGFE